MTRIKGAGAAYYHCMSRICGGEGLLGDREKEVLRGMLWQVADFCGVEVLSYVVMSNHFHVLVYVPTPEVVGDAEILRRYAVLYGKSRSPYQPDPAGLARILAEEGEVAEAWRERLQRRMHDLSAFMKTVKQRFSVWFNQTHGRYGTLWADRFKSVLVEADRRALSTVAAYLDLNPVRAGLVKDPAAYRWSNYGEAMGGATRAREALQRVFAGSEAGWDSIIADYRLILFGKGAEGSPKGATVDREEALKVVRAGGKIPLHHALRCRVRYFTDGAVLGSKAFVRAWFEANPAHRSSKRKTEPRPMEGAEWADLTVGRGLRRDVFS